MTYTRSDINTILVTNDKAVERAMIRLFELQNADEQRQGATNEQNGRGFSSSDARAGTRFARWIQGMDNNNVVRYAPKSLNNPKAAGIFGKYCQNGGSVMDRARKIALKHSAQLVLIANEKATKAEAPAPTHVETQPGTWAQTARIMAQGDDSGFDWDAWKDEMKEA
jgi:hypothetical protein